MPGLVCSFDASGQVIFSNEAYDGYFRNDENGGAGRNFWRGPLAELGKEKWARILRLGEGEAISCQSHLILEPNGEQRDFQWCLCRTSPDRFWANGLEVERKPKGLAESDRILELQPELVCQFQPSGRIAFANPAFRAFASQCSRGKGTASGATFFDIVPRERRSTFRDELSQAAMAGEPFEMTFGSPADGTGERVTAWSVLPVFDERGQLTVFLATGRDATREAQLESELTEARKAAQAARTAKSLFLSSISHELRTPLNSILGFSRLLGKEAPLDERLRGYVEAIEGSGHSLLGLLNDAIDLAKAEAGNLETRVEPMDVVACFEEVSALFRSRFEEGGLQFVSRANGAMPERLGFDEQRMRQMLTHVLGNALKFTEKGSVRLSYWVEASLEGPGKRDLCFQVADTGCGMDDAHLERVFEPFYQIKQGSGSAGREGGLGLALTKQIAAKLGGSVTISSDLGVGTLVAFRFPNLIIEERNAPEPQRESDSGPEAKSGDLNQLEPATLLAADDSRLNRVLLESYFRGTHHRVIIAEDGRQALEQARKHKPDAFLLDIRMPHLTGLEVASALRADPELSNRPIVFITASSFSDETENADIERLGDALLRKPLSASALLGALQKHLPQLREGAEESRGPACPPAEEEDASANWEQKIELGAILEKLPFASADEDWQDFRRLMDIGQLESFADALVGEARQIQDERLEEFGRGLRRGIDRMDLDRVESLLNRFAEWRSVSGVS